MAHARRETGSARRNIMCLFCASKPFGFTAASLTRRSFVSHSLALGSASAAVRAVVPVAALAQNATADMIIENTKIITLDPRAPRAQAIAVAAAKIIGVGARPHLEPMRGPTTRT